MLGPGVYPASVTPMTPEGKVDMPSLARLLAHFEATGCRGAVLAGTNGEGPSLSAVEKRDLLRDCSPISGTLHLILGVATPSLDEAVWLCKRAAEFGAEAVLLMAPSYFRAVEDQAIVEWFLHVLDRSPCPVLAYNFPKMTGVTLTPDMMAQLAAHSNLAGCKDSSGERANLAGYRQAMIRSDQVLFVGNEALLIEALEAGWTGTISGAANVISLWLSQVVADWFAGERDRARARFALLAPIIEAIRLAPQPPGHKRMLHEWGILDSLAPRLPLRPAATEVVGEIRTLMADRLGAGPERPVYPPK